MIISLLKVFLIGGAICAICQILIDKTKLTSSRILVGLVTSGVILGAFGIYKPFADFAQAGATVPLLGFGHALFQGVKDEIDSGGGLLGILSGGFTATAAGITAAIFFGYINSLIFSSHDKK